MKDTLNESAYQLLLNEADQILQLLSNQNTICLSCPVYEEIMDTKMYGLSEKVNFAIKLDIIGEDEGQILLSQLERSLSDVYEEVIKQK